MRGSEYVRVAFALRLCSPRQTSLVPFLALLDGRQSWATFYNEPPCGTCNSVLTMSMPCWLRPSHKPLGRLVMQNLIAAALLAAFYSAGGAVRPEWMSFGKALL